MKGQKIARPEVLHVRLSVTEAQAIVKAAERSQHDTVSGWARHILKKAAGKGK